MLKENNRENKQLEPNYKKWVVNSKCMPQIAASLILGKDPDNYVIIDKIDWREVTICNEEIKQVSEILCEGGIWWYYKELSIFSHINTAIKNRIDISQSLLSEVAQYVKNSINKDKNQFIKDYPYLIRKLEQLQLLTQSINPKTSKKAQYDLSEKERPQVLKIMLGMAIDKYGYKPSASKNTATGSNRDSIQAALESLGLNVSEDTIRKYLNEAVEMFPEVKSKNTEV